MILDENPRARLILLQGDGEPLLDPGFFAKIALARSRGLATQSISNGSMLNDRMIHQLVTSGPDVMLFSVDGMSPEDNDRIRRGMHCRQVMSSIRELVDARDRAHSPLVVGLLSILPAPLTVEAEAALRSFSSLGIDVLLHKPLNRAYEGRIRDYHGASPAVLSTKLRRQLSFPVSHQRLGTTRPCPQLAYRSPYYLWDGTRTACCILSERRYATSEYSHDALLERFRSHSLPADCERCSFFSGYPGTS